MIPLSIAVLVNHPPKTTFHPEIQTAFTDTFNVISPSSIIRFYDPVFDGEYPDPSHYDLIILSGGKADASADEAWILTMLDYVKRFVDREKENTKMGMVDLQKTKMLGICWGHQIIARAMGGSVGAVKSGPVVCRSIAQIGMKYSWLTKCEAGLIPIDLTKEGKTFFPELADIGRFRASQFHVREVCSPAPNFTALAVNNEAFVSDSNTILSFQAHPEIDGEFASKILEDQDTTYTEGRTVEEMEELIRGVKGEQDGIVLLRRVVEWIGE